jgi:8-oxo-dGTP diphosphatase
VQLEPHALASRAFGAPALRDGLHQQQTATTLHVHAQRLRARQRRAAAGERSPPARCRRPDRVGRERDARAARDRRRRRLDRVLPGPPPLGALRRGGLLVVAPADDEGEAPYVLLQHRAVWSHDGDTWGVPGGARGRAETAEQAARSGDGRGDRPRRQPAGRGRRARLRPRQLELHHAQSPARPRACRSAPTARASTCAGSRPTAWRSCPLHGGFARSWPDLRAQLRAQPA